MNHTPNWFTLWFGKSEANRRGDCTKHFDDEEMNPGNDTVGQRDIGEEEARTQLTGHRSW